jgi:hypothetical protein
VQSGRQSPRRERYAFPLFACVQPLHESTFRPQHHRSTLATTNTLISDAIGRQHSFSSTTFTHSLHSSSTIHAFPVPFHPSHSIFRTTTPPCYLYMYHHPCSHVTTLFLNHTHTCTCTTTLAHMSQRCSLTTHTLVPSSFSLSSFAPPLLLATCTCTTTLAHMSQRCSLTTHTLVPSSFSLSSFAPTIRTRHHLAHKFFLLLFFRPSQARLSALCLSSEMR